MKNVVITEAGLAIRIPVYGLPPLQGWALRLLIDIPAVQYKRGYWMSRWVNGPEAREFTFEPELHWAFNTESEANQVSAYLRSEAEIETEIVKISNP